MNLALKEVVGVDLIYMYHLCAFYNILWRITKKQYLMTTKILLPLICTSTQDAYLFTSTFTSTKFYFSISMNTHYMYCDEH